MVYVLEMQFMFESENGIWVKGYNNDRIDHEIFPENLELMQYTGLKDKNGKEIYSKDIAECLTNEGLERYVVDWLDELGAWGLFPVGPISKGEFLYSIGADTLEIIGNIYQNPKLLNGK